MDNITGMLSGVLPYISYAVNLFTRLLEIFASYLGIDISLGTDTDESEETE